MIAILILLALIAVPLAELYVIVQVADGIGILWTIVLLFAVSIAGGWLLKQQGLATWTRLRETMARGEMPTQEVVDGALILFGGALLLTPGFLTDAVGLVLLLPPSRSTIKSIFRKRFARRLEKWGGRRPRQASARVVRVERTRREEASSSPPSSSTHPSSSQLPSGEHPAASDGSPDTR